MSRRAALATGILALLLQTERAASQEEFDPAVIQGVLAVIGTVSGVNFQNDTKASFQNLSITLEQLTKMIEKCYAILSELPQLLDDANNRSRYHLYIETIAADDSTMISEMTGYKNAVARKASNQIIEEDRQRILAVLLSTTEARRQMTAWGPIGYPYVVKAFLFEVMAMRLLGDIDHFPPYKSEAVKSLETSAAQFGIWADEQDVIAKNSKAFWQKAETEGWLDTWFGWTPVPAGTFYLKIDGSYQAGITSFTLNETFTTHDDRNPRRRPMVPFFPRKHDDFIYQPEVIHRSQVTRTMLEDAHAEGMAAEQNSVQLRAHEAACIKLRSIVGDMSFKSASTHRRGK